MRKYLIRISILFFILTIAACTPSIETGESERSERKTELIVKEDFDITPYRTQVIIDEVEKKNEIKEPDVWYEYEELLEMPELKNEIRDTANGYRVQVISTDNLEEANTVRSEIYFKTNQKAVYIEFDPPVYKVKVGDFLNINDANDLSFKLSQLGYSDVRVVRELVNIFH